MTSQPSQKSPHIGWVGTGRMGYAMAKRLIMAGSNLSVYNRSREKAEPLAEYGARVVESLSELASCDLVFTMLSTDDAVMDVFTGGGGLLAGPDLSVRTVIECSSISVDASAKLREVLHQHNISMLASPISGNPGVVEAGNASFVVSGLKSDFDLQRPALLNIARQATYVGTGELARIAKICHNVWLGVLTQSLAEVVVLAEKAGLARPAFLEFLNHSALGSTYTRAKTPSWIGLDFSTTFTAPLMRKDMDLGLDLADNLDVPMQLASTTRHFVQTLINHGHIDCDFSALLLLQAQSSGLKLADENRPKDSEPPA
ncbi:6-phosphogluconate dehydrogenase [Burkholderia sp. WAC0059]|uniref:NAD(P)-dependent oxidoreductase n=1 Tax=Burkholderia sp. WAC0059 TaxID=2066022 RepID=UPI000C7F3BFD|nr:NAD(P)-dependent oxidoreductase [Burkholderia sp. WAC0059]PLZ02438.1 6-phosphogluconate dehydrogenase [Burkholderia sp. WAC0059]